MHTTSLYGQTDAKVFLVTVSDLDALKKKKTKGCNFVFAHIRDAFSPAGMTYKCYFLFFSTNQLRSHQSSSPSHILF